MKQLALSVHDVTPHHFERLKRAHALFQDWGVGSRYSMLVVPDFWSRWPLQDYPDFTQWLKARVDEGVEIILHGYSHFDQTRHPSLITRWKARALTNREGEFLGLSQQEATRRLCLGKQQLESLFDQKIGGFVAPAWLYSAGTHRALQALDFRFAEDHWRVWSPTCGKTLGRSPVLSYASRTPARLWSSILWSRLSTLVLRPAGLVRLAVHPHDLDQSRLVEEIHRALADLLPRRQLVCYRDIAS